MWPISIEKAKRLQIEITTFCNAACPSCERANYKVGTIYKRHLNSIHVSLKQLQKWLPLEEMKSMEVFHLCGNIDEPTLNPEIFEICEWLEQYARVHISTNGGTKNKEFWKKLATLKNMSVIFGIDGLEDTNHIYRKNVRWVKLHDNYSTYIKHGGLAFWQFIIFEHNKHQLEDAREKSIEEGFASFNTIHSMRENHEVEAVANERVKETCVKCKATYDNDDLGDIGFYIDVRGTVWPCCWMATSWTSNNDIAPKTKHFGHFLAHNLNYDTLQDIISGDLFTYLWENLGQFDICNQKCKENITDTIVWNADWENLWKR
jgi:hypothetical protein